MMAETLFDLPSSEGQALLAARVLADISTQRDQREFNASVWLACRDYESALLERAEFRAFMLGYLHSCASVDVETGQLVRKVKDDGD